MSKLNSNAFWKLILAMSVLFIILGVSALNNLDMNISGDGVPNRPQQEPPLEYPWDQAIPIILIVVLSGITTAHSINKVFRQPL